MPQGVYTNVKQTLTHNISIQEHKTIDGKFPYVTQISEPFYLSRSISAAFENNQNGETDIQRNCI